MVWRPIIRHITTLEEIRRAWDLVDLLDAHEALDVQEDAEAFQVAHMNPGK